MKSQCFVLVLLVSILCAVTCLSLEKSHVKWTINVYENGARSSISLKSSGGDIPLKNENWKCKYTPVQMHKANGANAEIVNVYCEHGDIRVSTGKACSSKYPFPLGTVLSVGKKNMKPANIELLCKTH